MSCPALLSPVFSLFSVISRCGYGPESRALRLSLRLRNFANLDLVKPLGGERGETDLGESPLAKLSPDEEDIAALLRAGLGGQRLKPR